MTIPQFLGTEDVPRIETVLHRMGQLLAEQPDSYRAYHNGCQEIRRDIWCDEQNETVRDVIMLAYSTRYWEGNDLGQQLGKYLPVVDASLHFARREKRLNHWSNPENIQRAVRDGDMGEESLRRMIGVLEFEDYDKARHLVRTSLTMLRRALRLYRTVSERNADAVQVMQFKRRSSRSRIAERLGLLELAIKVIGNLVDSLAIDNVTVEGVEYPQSIREWDKFEAQASERLEALGLPKQRVIALFEKTSQKPGADRARINKNIRRRRKRD